MEHIAVCFRPIPVQTSSQENWRKEHQKITNLFKQIKAVNWKENTNIPIFWKVCISAQFAQNDKMKVEYPGILGAYIRWSVARGRLKTRLSVHALSHAFCFPNMGSCVRVEIPANKRGQSQLEKLSKLLLWLVTFIAARKLNFSVASICDHSFLSLLAHCIPLRFILLAVFLRILVVIHHAWCRQSYRE